MKDLPRGGVRRERPFRIIVDLHMLSAGGVNGGIKLLVLEHLRWLLGCPRFEVFALTNSELARELSSYFPHLKMTSLCATPHYSSPRATILKRVRAWWHVKRADLLYAPLWFSPFSSPSLPSVVLIVDTLHRDLPHTLTVKEVTWREQAIKHAIQSSCRFVCISEFVREKFTTHYSVSPSSTLISRPPLRLQYRGKESDIYSPTARPYFLYPANGWGHKNHLKLLRGFELYREHKDILAWDLVLTGHFYQGSVAAEIQECVQRINAKGDKSVHVLGHLNDGPFANLFSLAGALVFPSLYEGYGMPILEAMQLGVPVLCSDAAALPEVAGDAAVFFSAHSEQEISAAMTKVSRDEILRRRLSDAGKLRASSLRVAEEREKLLQFFSSISS